MKSIFLKIVISLILFCIPICSSFSNEQMNKYNLPKSFRVDKELYKTLEEENYEKMAYIAKIAIYYYPNDAIGYFYMGIALDELGKHKEAVSFYTVAIKLRPNVADNYQNRGLAYLRMGDKEKARADYEKALEIDPNHEIAKKQLAKLNGKTIYYQIKFKE